MEVTPDADRAEPLSETASPWWFTAIALALCILPIAAAGAAHLLMRSVHRPVETVLVGADAKPEFVTALAWSPITGNALWVGTEAGRVIKLAADGAVEAITPSAGGPVLRIQPVSDSEHFDLVERAASLNSSSFGAQALFVRQVAEGADPESPGVATERGLFAVADDTARTRLVGVVSTTVPLDGFQTKAAQSSAITTALELAVARTDSQPSEPVGTGSPRVLVPIPGSGAVAAGFDDGSVAEIVRVEGVPGQLQSQQAQPVQPAAQRVAALEIGRVVASSQSNSADAAAEPAITALAVATPSDGSTVIAAAIGDGSIGAWRRAQSGAPWNEAPSIAAYEPSQQWTEVGSPIRTTLKQALAMSSDLRRIAGIDQSNLLEVQSIDGSAESWGPPGGWTPNGTSPNSNPANVAVAFSSDSVAFVGGRIDLVGRGGASRWTIDGTGSSYTRSAFSADGSRIAVAREDGTLRTLDSSTGQPVGRPWNARGLVESLAFDPSGSTLAVGLGNGSLALFDQNSAEPVTLPVSPDLPLTNVVFTGDGRRIVTLDERSNLRTFSSRSLRLLTVVPSLGSPSPRRISGDGRFAAGIVLTRVGSLIISFDTATGREAARIGSLSDQIGDGDVWLNEDGTRLALFQSDGTIRIWQRSPGDDVETAMPRAAENGLRLSADGRALLLREPSGVLHFARLTGADSPRLRVVSMPEPVIDGVLNADGSQIIAACADATIRIVPTDMLSGDSTIVLTGHGGLVHRMALSPDGRYLASASIDGRLRITDLAQLALVARLPLFDLPTGPDLLPIRPQRLEGSPPTARPATAASLSVSPQPGARQPANSKPKS